MTLLSDFVNTKWEHAGLLATLTPRLRSTWVKATLVLMAVIWSFRKSRQNVRLITNPNAHPALVSGLRRIDQGSLYIPNLLRHSYIQLGQLLLFNAWQKQKEPTRRECVYLRHSGGDQILLDWFLPEDYVDPKTPIVLYIPGITGRLREATAIVDSVLAKGWITVVFHRRGHEDALKRPTFNIFGSAYDLHIAVQSIHTTYREAPLCLIGSSAGSAVMVRYLGQYGHGANVAAGVGLSPGYDIHGMWDDISGSFFDRYLTQSLKSFFVERNRGLLVMRDAEAVRRLDSVQTVQEFARHAAVFSSEHRDFNEVVHTYDDWLDITCPLKFMGQIRVPTLCLNALDDPICHRGVVEKVGMKLPESNPYVALLLTNNGSHCAHQSVRGLRIENWGFRIALDFFEGVLDQHRVH